MKRWVVINPAVSFDCVCLQPVQEFANNQSPHSCGEPWDFCRRPLLTDWRIFRRGQQFFNLRKKHRRNRNHKSCESQGSANFGRDDDFAWDIHQICCNNCKHPRSVDRRTLAFWNRDCWWSWNFEPPISGSASAKKCSDFGSVGYVGFDDSTAYQRVKFFKW